jgi:hypothetical protein
MKGDQIFPQEVRKALYEGEQLEKASKFYKRLSDYIHPNAVGWPEYLTPFDEAQMFGLTLYPVYEATAANESIVVLAYSIRMAFLSVEGPFHPWLTRLSKDLESSFRGLDELLPF